MDVLAPSLSLLAHFDPAARVEAAEGAVDRGVRMRGVAWVLQRAAALGVLVYSVSVLLTFGYCIAAEQQIARAARAGVLEASLPRASRRTIEQAVWRRLAGLVTSSDQVRLSMRQNGVSVRSDPQPRGGDRLSLAVAVPVRAVLPNWLQKFTSWRDDAPLEASADRIMPGKQLRAEGRKSQMSPQRQQGKI